MVRIFAGSIRVVGDLKIYTAEEAIALGISVATEQDLNDKIALLTHLFCCALGLRKLQPEAQRLYIYTTQVSAP